ncbi:MAG: hypothetical protein SCJ97_08605 [Bacillota bacterium]|nr:hypothetical protein [Bacillota bacterium]
MSHILHGEETEYCYCHNCKRIRADHELEMTAEGLRCKVCGGSDFDQSGWVVCPHQKVSAVKCPRAGKGIIRDLHGYDCLDRCFFRV